MKAGTPLSIRIGLATLLGLAVLPLAALGQAAKPDAGKPPTAATPPRPAAAPAAAPAANAPPAPEPAKGAEPVKRVKVSCAEYRAGAEERAKHNFFNTRLKPGSWGNIPPEIQKLPPRAKLCGSDGMGQVVIVSPLFGQALGDYYTPLFTKIGFKPLTCAVKGSETHCRNKRHRDIGILVTDAKSEAYVLSVIRRGGKARPLSQTAHDR